MAKALVSPLVLSLLAILIAELVVLLSWKRLDKLRRVAICILVAAHLLVTLLCLPVTANLLNQMAEGEYTKDGRNYPKPGSIDVVVVLGGGFVQGVEPSLDDLGQTSYPRVVHGVRAYKSAKARLIVMQGGSATSEPAKMAELMRQLAIDMGVPPGKVLIEPKSRNTWEHPLELEKLGVVKANDRIGVVTSARHLARAMAEYRRLFPNAVPIPADFAIDRSITGIRQWIPDPDALRRSVSAILEWIGTLTYAARHQVE